MKTLIEIPTVGGRGTQPGGIALRYASKGEFIVHDYNTDEAGTARHYFQGSYFHIGNTAQEAQEALADAMKELARRVERQSHYSGGGEIDVGKFAGFGSVPGLVDASGAMSMAADLASAG